MLLSINEWDAEQERVVLLSTHAYYRVKFDFAKRAVARYTRCAVADVLMVCVVGSAGCGAGADPLQCASSC